MRSIVIAGQAGSDRSIKAPRASRNSSKAVGEALRIGLGRGQREGDEAAPREVVALIDHVEME